MLFLGAFLAAAVSGTAGFGGALLLLPLLVHVVGAGAAVPLLTLAQLVGNCSRVVLGYRAIRWRPVGIFLLGALPMSILGALSFVALPASLVARLIGATLLTFIALRTSGFLRQNWDSRLLCVSGGVVGFLSGLVGSAGPLGAAIFLSLGLSPVSYIASEATTALAMHTIKILVYQRTLHFDLEFWRLAALLSVAMVLGTWAGKTTIERMPVDIFRRVVTGILVVIGLQMLFG